MAWTAPSITITGQLITAGFWNAQITNNLNLLKTSIMDDGTLRNASAYSPIVLADVNNTVTETTAVSFIVPGGDFNDGDGFELNISFLFKCDAAGSPHVVSKLYWGAAVIQLGDVNVNNNNVDRNWLQKLVAWRVGNDLWVTQTSSQSLTFGGNWDPTLPGNAVVMSTPSFATIQTVALKLKLDQASAGYYVKPKAARVLRWKL